MSTEKIKPGKDSKDSMYLKRIKAAIALKLAHPRHLGVKMQAHHVISAEGMKRSTLGKRIKKFGYDINLLPNLVFIPCTLQGACHLGVQPHRGNHTAKVADEDSYDDDSEPGDYHDMVARRIRNLGLPLSKECEGSPKQKSKIVTDELDKLSILITGLIQASPSKAPLTDIADHFSPRNRTGCGGHDSVTLHTGEQRCAVERNHLERQGPGQKRENIRYVRTKPYKLKPGE